MESRKPGEAGARHPTTLPCSSQWLQRMAEPSRC